jgi:uncharacterized membrane protein YoaK (UPF0700 family)
MFVAIVRLLGAFINRLSTWYARHWLECLIVHLGYLVGITYMLALSFVLTSYWVPVPDIIISVVTVIRTSLEDDILK